jgi:hypothetical protein
MQTERSGRGQTDSHTHSPTNRIVECWFCRRCRHRRPCERRPTRRPHISVLRCTGSYQRQGRFAKDILRATDSSRAVVGRRCWQATHPTSPRHIPTSRPKLYHVSTPPRLCFGGGLSLLADADGNFAPIAPSFSKIARQPPPPPPLRLPLPHPMLSLSHTSTPEVRERSHRVAGARPLEWLLLLCFATSVACRAPNLNEISLLGLTFNVRLRKPIDFWAGFRSPRKCPTHCVKPFE